MLDLLGTETTCQDKLRAAVQNYDKVIQWTTGLTFYQKVFFYAPGPPVFRADSCCATLCSAESPPQLSVSLQTTWRFPKIGVPFLGVPIRGFYSI